MNSQEIFTLALGLQPPWEVTKIYFQTAGKARTLHTDIGFVRGSRFPDAKGVLCPVHDTQEQSKIYPFHKVVNLLKAHWSGFINYINSQILNGILEGINSKIQLAKKRARGYRTKSQKRF